MGNSRTSYQDRRITNLTSPEAVELSLSLVANLIGEENNLPLMGEARLTPETFPKTDNPKLEFARTVLRHLYAAVANDLPPTKENSMPRLISMLSRQMVTRQGRYL